LVFWFFEGGRRLPAAFFYFGMGLHSVIPAKAGIHFDFVF